MLSLCGPPPKAYNPTPIKEKIDKLDLIRIKNSASKDTIKKVKRKPTEWEKLFANYISGKGLISRI